MKRRAFWLDYLPMGITTVLILYFAISRGQSIIKTLPTLITLAVLLLMAHANRHGFLLGGLNSILYGVSYLSEGLYFSLVSTILISFPVQLYSWFHWKHHTGKDGVELKILGIRKNIFVILLNLLGWGICCFALAPLFANASYPILDAFVFVLGITVSLLAARRFVDSQYINLVCTTCNLVMWILLSIRNPENWNYVIISLYNFYRVAQTAVNWTILYVKSKKQGKKEILK